MTVPSVHLRGDSRTVGRLHGDWARNQIRTFLDDNLARLNRILEVPLEPGALANTIRQYAKAIERETPGLFAEIEGLAEGAGIGLDGAVLLQIRRELMGYSRIQTAGDCTTLARSENDSAILAQTIDLNGNLEDQMTVLGISHPATGRRAVVLTFSGLLGYLGLNSDGLAIGLNLVLAGQWAPGLPPYLAIRHLLDTCADVESCLVRLRELRLASSRSLTLCDREQTAVVEIADSRLSVARGTKGAHTNHFVADVFRKEDQMNPFARNGSERRLRAVHAGLMRLPAAADPEHCFAMLSEPPINVPDSGDIRREKTVGAVVLCPEDGALHVRRGDPSKVETEVFRLPT